MVFFISLVAISAFFAALGSYTPVAARNKTAKEKTDVDKKLLKGTATLSEKNNQFISMFLSGLYFPPMLITSGVIWGLAELYIRFIAG